MDHLVNKYKRSSFYICDSLSNHIISPLTKLIHENNILGIEVNLGRMDKSKVTIFPENLIFLSCYGVINFQTFYNGFNIRKIAITLPV